MPLLFLPPLVMPRKIPLVCPVEVFTSNMKLRDVECALKKEPHLESLTLAAVLWWTRNISD
jgi:hypothetical protein